jgi:uncharacterized membrane protein
MEELFKEIAAHIALGVEMAAAMIIAYAAIEAVIGLFRSQARPDPRRPFLAKRTVFVRFGVWLMLGLEFELAADVVRSAIAPTWDDIGQLAVIAVIRTFLNFFLGRDLEKVGEPFSAAEAIRRNEA